MINLESFMDNKTIVGYCTTEELNNKDIYVEAYSKGIAKKPKDYILNSKTIIVIGNAIEFSEDTYSRNIFKSTYPGYGRVLDISKQIEKHLKNNGYEAKIAHSISQKSAAVQAGLGVWGKNSLLVNEIFGTHLRLAAVVTNWIPDSYSKPLNIDLCGECEACINRGCVHPYRVDAKKCAVKYIQKKELSVNIHMCSICQKLCKYNNYK